MTDIIDRRPGGGGAKGDSTRYHDEGDGSYSEATAAKLRVWDATDGAWNKGTADHATGGLKVYVAGQAGGGSAVSIADGADVAQGTTTDAAVVSDASGTVIGFLRGLVKLFAARIPVLGQTTMAASTPVAIASNQTAVPVSGTVTASGPLTDTQLRAAPVPVKTDQTTHGTTDLVAADITKVAGTALDVNSGNKSAGTQRVVLATDQPALTTRMPVDPSGVTSPVSIATAPVLVAGSAEIGRVGLSSTGTGYTPFLADVITTVVQVRTGAGKFGGLVLLNTNSSLAWLQCFDVATGTAVTLGTTVPTFSIPIPINATAANGVGIVFAMDVGIALALGLKVAATTTPKGATTVTTGLSGLIYYA